MVGNALYCKPAFSIVFGKGSFVFKNFYSSCDAFGKGSFDSKTYFSVTFGKGV